MDPKDKKIVNERRRRERMNNAEEKLKVLILKYLNCQLSKLEKADTLEKAVELLKQFDEGKVISQRGKEVAFAEFERKFLEQLTRQRINENILKPILETLQAVKVDSGLMQQRVPIQRPPQPRVPSMPFVNNPPTLVNTGLQQMLVNFGVLWQHHQIVQKQLGEANAMIQRFNHLLVSHVNNRNQKTETVSQQRKVAPTPLRNATQIASEFTFVSKKSSSLPKNEVKLVDSIDTHSMETPRAPPRPYKRKNFETPSIQDSSSSSDSGIFDPTPKKIPAIERDIEPVLKLFNELKRGYLAPRMPLGQSIRRFFKVQNDDDPLLPGPGNYLPQDHVNGISRTNEKSSFRPSRISNNRTPSPTKNKARASVYVGENSHVRYRKSRSKTGGNEKDHWHKENLVHMKAFENDVTTVMEIRSNYKTEQEEYILMDSKKDVADPIFSYYQLPSNIHDNEHKKSDTCLIPAHIAAIGGSLDTCTYLNDRVITEAIRNDYYFPIHPLHLIALYGPIKSHRLASQNNKELANIFLNDLEIADMFDRSKTTPLHYACMAGNIEMVKLLIEHEANVDAIQRTTHATPLHFACQSGDEEIVKFLLDKGADPDKKDSYSNTSLHYAVRGSDNPEIARAILEKVKNNEKIVSYKNNGGITAIRLAVEENRLRVAEYLLKQHFGNHNKDENEGKHEECGENDALLVHLAAQRGSPKMIKLLIENGLSIEERDNRGQTPLHFAAEENHLQLVRTLIEEKADKEARDERGFTPLLAAASRDSLEVVRELLGQTLITALSFYGENIVLVAVKHNATKVVKFLFNPVHKDEFKDIVRIMLKQVDIHLNCPLHFVAQTGNIEILKLIIPFYQEINMRNNEIKTPLHIAARFGHTEVARQLLHVSVCSINLVDIHQKTSLFAAVENGSIPMIKLLLENGANPMARCGTEIALDFAIKHGNIDVVRLLLDELKEDKDEFRKVFPLHEAVSKRKLEILKLVLDKKYTEIDQVNKEGITCFDLAIDMNYREGVELLLNNEKWHRVVRRRYVKSSRQNPHPQSPMQNLIVKMPEMAKIVLDKCVSMHGEHIYYNYEYIDDTYVLTEEAQRQHPLYNKNDIRTVCLTPFENIEKINGYRLKKECICREENYSDVIADHPLNLMLKNHSHELLSHDLVHFYVTTKWNSFAKWFYYGLCAFHLLFVLLLTEITIDIKPEKKMTLEEKIRLSSTNECLAEPWSHVLFLVFAITLFTLAIGKALRDWTVANRIPDFILAFLSFLASTPCCAIMGSTSQWRTLVILNFFAWFHLLNLVRKLPRFGVYVQMVWHTIMSFIRFSPVFILFLLPFIVSFHVLLGEDRGLLNLLQTMVRTLVMMTGEFDYEAKINDHSTFLTYLIFFLFIFIGSVFLMNLLVGLAVSDTNTTMEKAVRTRLRLQIETIHHVEVMMTDSLRRRLWTGFKKIKVTEKDAPLFDMKKVSHWCRWLGLPKTAIKRDYTQVDRKPSFGVSMRKKNKEEKLKKRQKEDLAEIRDALFVTQTRMMNIEKSFNDLLETIKQERNERWNEMKKVHEVKIMDADD
ncbi:hypothetical protein FO519_000028 [Halicephalobus sp. NKZ332]|nr:hypothetical protein FO519_000028 [Halicephalobus sp. NKZ332]